jgi:hypothetical protein
VGMSDHVLLSALNSNSRSYVYETPDDHRVWRVAGAQWLGKIDYRLVQHLRRNGLLTPRWPGSEADQLALTVPRHAWSPEAIRAKINRKYRKTRSAPASGALAQAG